MDAADILTKNIDDEVRQIESNLGAGCAKDYAEYQHLCGRVRGLLSARLNIETLKHRMESIDE
jgi:hypothetical protein